MQNETGREDAVTVIAALLTTAEAARLVNIGERTLWRWSRSGIAPAPVKINGTVVRYRRDEYIAWIESGCPRVDGKVGQ
ncbi:MAG: helix-turn-helix domain-containing protein [Planctomycetes bacterium]|nr:helix-turn-helix domain-containing protein [Planctomycetota bacterium]